MDSLRIVRVAGALLVGLTVLAASCADPQGAGSPQPIGAAELSERIRAGSPPRILDVRTREEYAAGHVPGAVNIPYDELSSRLAEIDADKAAEVVVYCQSGRRADVAEGLLRRAGYTNLRDLEGHMQAWNRSGHPTNCIRPTRLAQSTPEVVACRSR